MVDLALSVKNAALVAPRLQPASVLTISLAELKIVISQFFLATHLNFNGSLTLRR